MREKSCTFLPLATRDKGKVGQGFLFSAFPKGEKGKVLPRKIAEKAEKKGLKFFLNNYTISAISIGFALRRIVHAKAPSSPRKEGCIS
jgi:hypothetical protein